MCPFGLVERETKRKPAIVGPLRRAQLLLAFGNGRKGSRLFPGEFGRFLSSRCESSDQTTAGIGLVWLESSGLLVV